MPNFIEIAQTAVDILQFVNFSKWRLPLSWILKFLMVRHAKKVEPVHCAKFRLNHPGRHVVIIFIIQGTAILNFKNFKFLTVETVKRVKLHHCAKFRPNRSNRGRDFVIF